MLLRFYFIFVYKFLFDISICIAIFDLPQNKSCKSWFEMLHTPYPSMKLMCFIFYPTFIFSMVCTWTLKCDTFFTTNILFQCEGNLNSTNFLRKIKVN